MICPYCGKEIADESNFCEFCGTRVAKSKNHKLLWNISIAVLFLATIGGVVYYVHYSKRLEKAISEARMVQQQAEQSRIETEKQAAEDARIAAEEQAAEAMRQAEEAKKLAEEAQKQADAAKKVAEQQAVKNKKTTQTLQGYVDLGLPSGTLWKYQNEDGGFYTFDEAIAKFGSNLPTKEQLEELKNSCLWTWTGSGYKVEGPNGNSITLPAAGYRNCDGSVYDVGSYGDYWSSTPYGSEDAWDLYFGSGDVGVSSFYRCIGLSVRLVR